MGRMSYSDGLPPVAAKTWLRRAWRPPGQAVRKGRASPPTVTAGGQRASPLIKERPDPAAWVWWGVCGAGCWGWGRPRLVCVGGHRVVLLHGQPGSAADWQQVAGRLAPGLGVVALDRPGYGASRERAGGFAVNARAVVAELDGRGIGRAVLVGHSYGGGVALAVAQLAPERVEALVLLASVGPGCLTGWDQLLAAPVAGEVCAVTAWRLTPWLARAWLAGIAWWRRRPAGCRRVSSTGPSVGPGAPRSRAAVAQLPDRAAGAGPRARRPHRRRGRRGAAGAAARRPPRHAHPGRHHPPAGRGLAQGPRAAGAPHRAPPAPPRGTPDRGRDHRVPDRAGHPATARLTVHPAQSQPPGTPRCAA